MGGGAVIYIGRELALHLLKILEMQATFFQKVIMCAVAGFFAACLMQWGKMFVTGADEALNAGYKNTSPAQLGTR
jgi:hypothetical protein